MFKLNFKIAIRNLLKNKGYTLVNILGLALGLAGFIFILLYINHQKSYDHWHPKLKNVYQLQEVDQWSVKEDKIEQWSDYADMRLIELLKTAMPQIESMASFNNYEGTQSILIKGKFPFLQDGIVYGNGQVFDVFPYHFIYGDSASAFVKPGSLVIKEDFAKKHFGSINPIGQTIRIKQQNFAEAENYTITGVIEEPKTPNSISFELLVYNLRQFPLSDSYNRDAVIFAKIRDNHATTELTKIAQSIYAPFKSALLIRQEQNPADFSINNLKLQIRFMPIHEIHQNPLEGKSWLSQIKPVIILSTLLLLISIINFVNMFTAQAISRAKEVGIKKAIGAHKKTLVAQFFAETSLQCLIALGIAVMLIEGFLPYLNSLFEISLNFSGNQQSLLIAAELIAILIIVTLFAGVYPAFYLSSYQPQKVLKGNFSNSDKGKVLRSLLVGIQCVIAVGFLIGIMVIAKQVDFMENRDPGFSAKSVININSPFSKKIGQQLRRINGVKYVGSINGFISLNKNIKGKYKFKNESRELKTVMVNFEGLSALGVKLLSGRLFDVNQIQDSVSSVIINETLQKSYGENMVGKYLYAKDSIPSQVIGVIKDIQVAGFEKQIEPTVYSASVVNGSDYPNLMGGNYVVRYETSQQQKVLQEIEALWKRHYPEFPITYNFVQDDLSKVLLTHKRLMQMVKIFTFLSISLSLIGLFALASFLTKLRTKEIAIRKILGADHFSIYFLLNKSYFWLMIFANIISWPIIYLAINYWLKGFAYRIDMPLFPFVLAFCISMCFTMLIVSMQIKKVIHASPVDALKYE